MIKPVDEIPKGTRMQRETYRQMIRDDIQGAIDKGIHTFEFDGEYNYKYLAIYAREEADVILKRTLREAWKICAEQNENGGWDYPNTWERHIRTGPKYIEVVNHKEDDRNHVYCVIHPEAIGELIDLHKEHLAIREQNRAEMDRERASKKTDVRNLIKLKEGVEHGGVQDQAGG